MQILASFPALCSVALAAGGRALIAAAWLGLHRRSPQSFPRLTTVTTCAGTRRHAGPPWRYGRDDARFTVVEYADLECPFCRAYFAVLKQLDRRAPEVNWQWHHLPLTMHEPAAIR